MGADHQHHHHHHETTGRNLSFAFWINTAFALIEFLGGLYTNSVAILSDSLHDLGDSLSLGLAYYFHRVSERSKDKVYSYGYRRFSLLGAIINSLILIVGSSFILKEAIQRLREPEKSDAAGMLLLAMLGVIFNLIAMLRLKRGGSIQERIVSLHFLEDILGWIAVLIGSVTMLLVDLPIIDPVLSIGIMIFILFNVIKNLAQLFRIVLQGSPLNVDTDSIRSAILAMPHVTGIHDVHTWSMDGEYNIMSLHVVLKETTSQHDVEDTKSRIRHDLSTRQIHHVTIETEFEDSVCQQSD